MDLHFGQAYWTGILTVLFFNMPVQYACPFCEMCQNEPRCTHKNVCPAVRVKSEFLGYNEYFTHELLYTTQHYFGVGAKNVGSFAFKAEFNQRALCQGRGEGVDFIPDKFRVCHQCCWLEVAIVFVIIPLGNPDGKCTFLTCISPSHS